VTATATIWRTCPVCGRSFEQPDDPGRKRVYCSRACQQAAYRARQRAGANGAGQWRTGRQDQRSRRQEWRSDWRHQRAGTGAGQRQRGGQQRQPPPGSANGSGRPRAWCSACGGLRAAHAVHHDQAAHERARRRYEALLRKAAGTTFEPEAAACRAKAEALYAKYGL
jgi:hypothetical protein